MFRKGATVRRKEDGAKLRIASRTVELDGTVVYVAGRVGTGERDTYFEDELSPDLSGV
jgi:hypothetical protein